MIGSFENGSHTIFGERELRSFLSYSTDPFPSVAGVLTAEMFVSVVW